MTHFLSNANSRHTLENRAYRLSLAPMMAWSCRHGRMLIRTLAPQARLYSEMLVDQSIIHGNRDRLLAHHPREAPLAFQIASANPKTLSQAVDTLHQHTDSSAIAEINLNVGCPSPRVQAGGFGACLMKDPILLAELTDALCRSAQVPVSVKMRLGVDDQYNFTRLLDLLDMLRKHGCSHIILHARSAWLAGLDPKQNRHIPPLDHDAVQCVKAAMPKMRIITNGGLDNVPICLQQLKHVDGIMIGRAAFSNPWLMAQLNAVLSGNKIPSLEELLNTLIPYWQEQLSAGARSYEVLRSAMNLIRGVPGARYWRTTLSAAYHTRTPNLQKLLAIAKSITAHHQHAPSVEFPEKTLIAEKQQGL